MERLTSKRWKDLSPDDCCRIAGDCTYRCFGDACPRVDCLLPRLYAKLARYEDTGLQPEQVDPYVARPLRTRVRRVRK